MKLKSLMVSVIVSLCISPLFAANNAMKNGEVIAILEVVNKNEIAAANLALKKSTNKLDIEFAKLMKKEHSKNLDETMKISKEIKEKPVATETSKTLKEEGKNSLAELSKLNKKEFDKAYIDMMVKDHKAALQLIDTDLIPNASNDKLKKHLEESRMHVNDHLQKAMEIQQQLTT